MRRLLVPTLLVVAGIAAGLGSAATISGTNGPDRLRGTAQADVLLGRGGNDRIEGLGGNDLIDGGLGSDILAGNAGADRIVSAGDRIPDQVACGAGRDVVNAGLNDSVGTSCEVVSRQLSRDTLTNSHGQHETQVEPDSFAFRSTIVTVFQVGRFSNGGASSIGFATSGNAGRSWTNGLLPNLSVFPARGARYEAVSDPSVAYDALHRTWLASSLALGGDTNVIAISRSANGRRWSAPIAAVDSTTVEVDKPWIACDNGVLSRFRGRCYLGYTAFPRGDLELMTSRNGGRTWSAPVVVTPGLPLTSFAQGVQPLSRPDGSLVLVYDVFTDPGVDVVAASRSNDGGSTFTAAITISRLNSEPILGLRAPAFPSAAVDSAGTVFVAWSDCAFRTECDANDIVLATSPNGTSWRELQRVPTGEGAIDSFLPGLDVTAGAGGRTRVAIAYYSLPRPQDCNFFVSCPGADVDLITSADGGASWNRAQRLTARTMRLEWLADGAIGSMVGDYISTSFVGGHPVPVFSLGLPPVGNRLRESIFATTRLPG